MRIEAAVREILLAIGENPDRSQRLAGQASALCPMPASRSWPGCTAQEKAQERKASRMHIFKHPSFTPITWTDLTPGDIVTLLGPEQAWLTGTVDQVSPTHELVWIRALGLNERRLLLREDVGYGWLGEEELERVRHRALNDVLGRLPHN